MSERRTFTYASARAAEGPRARGWVLAALIVAVAIGVLVWIGPGTESRPTATAPRVAMPRPTRDGAVQAAVSALYRLSIPALLNRPRFDAALMDVAAPRAVGRVRASFGAAAPTMLAAFAERPRVLRGAPLGYRVDHYSQQAADIAIWSVAVAATRRYGPQVQWRTLTVELVWTAAGWKVAGGTGRAGPVPTGSVERLVASTSSFEPLRHVP